MSPRIVPLVDTGNGTQRVISDPTDTLGQYNAERARGIVHTPEWQAAMVELQAEHDAQLNREEAADG